MSSHIDPIVATCLEALQNGRAGQQVVIAVGRLIVAHAEMNERFHRAKSTPGGAYILDDIEEVEAVNERVAGAWKAFTADPDGQRNHLATELLEAAATLSRLPTDVNSH